MAAAGSLVQAAQQAWTNLDGFAAAGTLRTAIRNFCTTAEPLFPQDAEGNHPLANWLAVLRCFAAGMNPNALDWTGQSLRTAAQYVYRLCHMGQQLSSQNAITAGQTAALLAAYNANF